MKHSLTLLIVFSSFFSFAQVKTEKMTRTFWNAKEFSKDIAMFKAKEFLFRDVLGSTEKINKFEIIPLAAASSGELTTLLYKSSSLNKEGIILGFFGDYWNEAGAIYQGYSFINLEKDEAIKFLKLIDDAIEDHSKFLKDDYLNNNIYFKFRDIDVLIYASTQVYSIRLFWNGFDSTWEKTAFDRSKRRFERKID